MSFRHNQESVAQTGRTHRGRKGHSQQRDKTRDSPGPKHRASRADRPEEGLGRECTAYTLPRAKGSH